MLRKDGTAVFYTIEAFLSGPNYDRWVTGWMQDRLGAQNPVEYGFPKSATTAPSGDCWQQTGHHGTFVAGWGFQLLKLAREFEAEEARKRERVPYALRLVKISMTQLTTEVNEPSEGGFMERAEQ